MPAPSQELETIYQRASQRNFRPPSESSTEKYSDSSIGSTKSTSQADGVLLGEEEVSQIIESFELPKEISLDLLQAVKQARMRIHK